MQSIYGASATTTCAYHVSAHAQYDRPVDRSMTYIQTELALTSLVQGSLRSPQLNAARVCGVMGVVLRRYGIACEPLPLRAPEVFLSMLKSRNSSDSVFRYCTESERIR